MLVSGFCRDVFNKLPMEFAAETDTAASAGLRWKQAQPLPGNIPVVCCGVKTSLVSSTLWLSPSLTSRHIGVPR